MVMAAKLRFFAALCVMEALRALSGSSGVVVALGSTTPASPANASRAYMTLDAHKEVRLSLVLAKRCVHYPLAVELA